MQNLDPFHILICRPPASRPGSQTALATYLHRDSSVGPCVKAPALPEIRLLHPKSICIRLFPMPTDWGDNIIISHLLDEPELSEEFAGIFARLSAHNAAADAPFPNIVLDFAGVSYLNSSHLAQLLKMRKLLGELDRSLVLCAMGEDVWSIIRLSGLDKIFRHAPDPMTALASLQLEAD
ncbi:MAG: STAS domain-containing protein [Pyrinomonadaceae bacterium]|nr:STAS domain-containing protein [Phycisphaerales bacterium]